MQDSAEVLFRLHGQSEAATAGTIHQPEPAFSSAERIGSVMRGRECLQRLWAMFCAGCLLMSEVLKTEKKRKVGDGTPGPGRPKGVQNKTTKAVKEMVLAALDQAGGIDYLVRQADENPTAFMTLVGKVLPLQLSGDAENPIKSDITVHFIKPLRD
jgi:hypothetical protein